jgi:peptidoglycan/xylan/chitin deacetylase (PgdA/CDA1 family)
MPIIWKKAIPACRTPSEQEAHMRLRLTIFVLLLGTMVVFSATPQTPETASDQASVPILIYHSIRPYRARDLAGVRKYITTPEALDQEFAYLKDNGYVSVSFDDLQNRLQSGKALPPKPVIICFDDGPETQYTYALPLLKKYSYTATFFLFTNAIGRAHYLSWEQVIELSADGMQIGCHSRFHPYLTKITDENKLWDEISGAKERLEAHLGKPVTAYAYPFGQYNEHIVELVKKAGYTCARGTYPGIVHGREDLFTLTGLIRTADLRSLLVSLRGDYDQDRKHPITRRS